VSAPGSGADALRPLLYGDVPLERWPPSDDVEPGDDVGALFVAARQAALAGDIDGAIDRWQAIAGRRDVEARHRLQAWTALRAHGVEPSDDVGRAVLGVVVEVPVGEGLDVLAAYADGSVRYLNHAGGASIVDEPPLAMAADVDALLAVGQQLAERVGAWDGGALPALPDGHARLVLLTPAGFRFGQGPGADLFADDGAAAVFAAAARLLQDVVALGGS
jgi:hypothetical protein